MAVFSSTLFICLFIFAFLGLHLWLVEVPRLGVKSELQLPATARAVRDPRYVWSVTYTRAQGNDGIEPTSSGILVGFVSVAP